MGAAAILNNKKSQYFHDGWTNFDKIWHGDVPRPSRHLQQIKICALKIQNGALSSSGKLKEIFASFVAEF